MPLFPSPARLASARGILALAAALALVVSGCGGDSESETEAASAARPSQQASGAQSANSAQGKPASSPGQQAQQAQKGSESSGNKQGPSVPVPKGEPEEGFTPEQRSEATVANIELWSPAISEGGAGHTEELPSAFTCDGKGTWPPLRWQGVPEGTEELALFVLGMEPVEGELVFYWSVAGLDPELREIESGKLPAGAVVGENSEGRTGYSVCPTPGQGEIYVFALYALPEGLSPSRGFDPAALRKEALATSSSAGLMTLFYARR